jgi:hypothetical protein
MRAKLRKVNQWAREMRNQVELKELWKICGAKLLGYFRYYGVSYNSKRPIAFRNRVRQIMFKWINRRSQRRSMTWEEFAAFERLNSLPKTMVYVKLF